MRALDLLGAPKLFRSGALIAAAMDGNSLVLGQGGAGTTLPGVLSSLSPLLGAGVTVTNLGVGGQTTKNMDGLSDGASPSTSTADVDGAFVGGRTNVLLVWEGTNDLYYNGSAAAAAANLGAYIAHRKAAHPWRVVLLTVIPRLNNATTTAGDTDAALNGKIDVLNATLRSTWRSLGADALADVAAPGTAYGALMTAGVWTPAAFDAAGAGGLYYTGDGAGVRVHQTAAGYTYLASLVAPALARLHK